MTTNETKAPERIWAWPFKDWFRGGCSTHRVAVVGAKDVEYVHIDKHRKLEAENARLRAEAAAARDNALEEAAAWHLEVADHDRNGMEYSSLVGIPISNWDALDTSVKTHEWCAESIRALKGTPND